MKALDSIKKMSKIKRVMYTAAVVSMALMFTAFGIYRLNGVEFCIIVGITSMTVCYHFTIRLFIGNIVDVIMRNEADWRKPWFREHKFEEKLYKKLKVKKWKSRMPTADENIYALGKRPMERIIGATCQSEVIHELDIIASLAAILFAIPFGSVWVFVITSVLGAVFDLMFVIMQRYNRPRLLKTMKRSNR